MRMFLANINASANVKYKFIKTKRIRLWGSFVIKKFVSLTDTTKLILDSGESDEEISEILNPIEI